MQSRQISKTLDSMVARATFNSTKLGINHSLKDLLFLEILAVENSMGYQILASRLQDWQLYQMRLRLEQRIKNGMPSEPQHIPEQFYRDYIEQLGEQHSDFGRISSQHALLDIVEDSSTSASRILEMYNITGQDIKLDITTFIAAEPPPPHQQLSALATRQPAKEHPLAKFGIDLTKLAREGGIDAVVGRTQEINRVIEILSRRKKNNPILIGEAGVGKSAIIEGLALRIAQGEVPYHLANKSLFSLDVSALVAGTKFRGEFEERMQQLLAALRSSNDTILFIDEIHTIVGAGSTQGSLDTANILKPALARGELQTIGATTLDEYRTDIESDAALERRFQKIIVEPTSRDETLEILRNIAPSYEAHHNVRYSDEALHACVDLAARYITERHFPDKAIDLLDEAGARKHVSSNAPTNQQSEAAEVTRSDIEQIITSITGIPMQQITTELSARLRELEPHLRHRVVGQAEAVEKLSKSIRRSRAGLNDENRPIGVFMFVGPTGVGKTLLAKELSKWMFDHKAGLIRLDMSEYSQQHNVARLIGSPPGYVGYGEGGQLTEAVRRQPYSVILLDEIEKAHPEVFNSMLQIFDEGHLTDGAGRRVDFKNTIIIMTSNIGAHRAAQRPKQVGYASPSKELNTSLSPQSDYRAAIERSFSPEFLNRVDDIILFRTLSIEDIEQIIDLEMQATLQRLDRLGYDIEVSHEAKQHLAKLGYISKYGARSIKRTLIEQIEEPLSSMIINDEIRSGDSLRIELVGDKIEIKIAALERAS